MATAQRRVPGVEARTGKFPGPSLIPALHAIQERVGWLPRDPDRLGPSLAEFVGQPGYGTAQLRQDLDRFIFLLGGDDGESLFGPGAAG